MMDIGNSPIRLICFPHAGGSARSYIPWKRLVPPSVEVIAVQLPGRDYPTYSQIPVNFSELCDALMPHVRALVRGAPYALFGHSMGALLAYEVARLLQVSGDHLPVAVFVSGCQPPQRWMRRERRTSWTDAQILAEVVALGGTPEELIHYPELRDIILPILRYDYAILDTYVDKPGPALLSSLGVLGGLEDPFVSPKDLVGWFDQTQVRSRLQTFAGGHFFVQSELKEVVRFVASFLEVETILSRRIC